jgi:hypothetical protein
LLALKWNKFGTIEKSRVSAGNIAGVSADAGEETLLADLTTQAAADALNERGITTAAGTRYYAMQVHRVRNVSN